MEQSTKQCGNINMTNLNYAMVNTLFLGFLLKQHIIVNKIFMLTQGAMLEYFVSKQVCMVWMDTSPGHLVVRENQSLCRLKL